MKRFLVVAVALMGVTGLAFGQTVVGTSHDLSAASSAGVNAQVCVYCHSPHQASGANGQSPLWNQGVGWTPAATYSTYSSSIGTFDATDIADIGGGSLGSLTNASVLCMSCHDGTIGPANMFNEPNGETITPMAALTGDVNIGTNLSDDHPINFTYDTTLATVLDGDLTDPVDADGTGIAPAKLFGGKMQCGSCHDPHGTTFNFFLREDPAQSQICTTCHNK